MKLYGKAPLTELLTSTAAENRLPPRDPANRRVRKRQAHDREVYREAVHVRSAALRRLCSLQ